MKKISLLLAVLLSILSMKAQISLTDTQGNTLNGNIELNGSETFYFYVHNGSDTSIHFIVKAIDVYTAPGAVWEVCACGVCAQVDRPGQIGNTTELAANTDYTETHITYFPPETDAKENSTITLAVVNPFNRDDSVAISFTGITPTIVPQAEKAIIYPTITTDKLNFNFQAEAYQIYDMQGKIIEQGILKKQKTIPLTNISKAGTYFIRFKTQQGDKIFGFIKK